MSRRALFAAVTVSGMLCALHGGCVAVVAGAAGAMVASGGGSPTEAAGDVVGEVADRAGRAVSAGIRGISSAGVSRAGGDTIRAAERAGQVVKTAREAARDTGQDAGRPMPVLTEADSDVN